jgi:tRNA G10  N-methylase Trm11
MGNCLRNSVSSGAVVAAGKNENIKRTSEIPSVHQGLLWDRKRDVYEKYVEIEVLGQGSMGHVARVQVREGTEGGSAFHGKKTRSSSEASLSSLVERRKEKVEYALKSIRLDRVSPNFRRELQNEIEVLKGMVSALVCFLTENCGAWVWRITRHNTLETHSKEQHNRYCPPLFMSRTIPTLSRPLRYIHTVA